MASQADQRMAQQAFKQAGLAPSTGGSSRQQAPAAPPPPPPPRSRPRAASAALGLRPALASQVQCPAYATVGRCSKGDICRYAHSPDEAAAMQAAVDAAGKASRAPPGDSAGGSSGSHGARRRAAADKHCFVPGHPLYKVKLCRHWEASGACGFGSRCHFAHGAHELRPYRGRHLAAGAGGPPGAASGAAAGVGAAPHAAAAAGQMVLQPAVPAVHAPLSPEEQAEAEVLLSGAFLQEVAYGRPPAGAAPAAAAVQAATRPPAAAAAAATPPRLPVAPGYGAAQPAAAAGPMPPPVPTPMQQRDGKQQRQAEMAPAAAAGSSSGGGGGGRYNGGGGRYSEADLDVLRRRFSSLLCPLSLELFEDPVVAADGHAYERAAIEEWLYVRGNSTSPLTNEALPHKLLVPCVTLRRCAEEVLEYVAGIHRQAL